MSETATLKNWMRRQDWSQLALTIADPKVVSYVHPYGFAVFRLVEQHFAGWQIRVHLWPSSGRQKKWVVENKTNEQAIHAHGWDLLSIVLCGSVREEHYEVYEARSGTLGAYTVTSDYGPGRSRLSRVEASLEARLTRATIRGQSDGIQKTPTGLYHATWSTEAPAVTLVATRTHNVGRSVVLAPSDLETVENRRVPLDNLADWLSYYEIAGADTGPPDLWASFVFICDDRNSILMVRPNQHPELWQPVGGRSENTDRDPSMTLDREVLEEVGFVLDWGRTTRIGYEKRDVGGGNVHFWVAQLSDRPNVVERSNEIAEYKWVPLEELKRLNLYGATNRVLAQLSRIVRSTGTSAAG